MGQFPSLFSNKSPCADLFSNYVFMIMCEVVRNNHHSGLVFFTGQATGEESYVGLWVTLNPFCLKLFQLSC